MRDGELPLSGLEAREEDADFALGRFVAVAAMNEVLGHLGTEISTDGSWRGRRRIGGAHHGADDSEGVFWALEYCHKGGTAAHEANEVVVETLANVLFIMLTEGVGIEDTKLASDKLETLALEAVEDLPYVSAFYGVGLTDDKGTAHPHEDTG